MVVVVGLVVMVGLAVVEVVSGMVNLEGPSLFNWDNGLCVITGIGNCLTNGLFVVVVVVVA